MPATRDLVAAVGNPWLRDLGFGFRVLEELRRMRLGRRAELRDLGFGTVAAWQILSARRWRQVVFVAATSRGEPPGTLRCTRAHLPQPEPQEVHARIGDGVMGLVSLDNLLIMARHLGGLPAQVLRVEVEPCDDTWGDGLSPQIGALVRPAALAIREAVVGGG